MKGPATEAQPSYGDVRGWVENLRARDSIRRAEARACLEYFGLPTSPDALVVAVRRGAIPQPAAVLAS